MPGVTECWALAALREDGAFRGTPCPVRWSVHRLWARKPVPRLPSPAGESLAAVHADCQIIL